MKRTDVSSRSPGRLVPTQSWQVRRRDGVDERVLVKGLAFVPNPLPPKLKRTEFLGRLSDDLLNAAASVARLDATVSSLVDAKLLILRPFALREATLSSKIEDTFASAEEVAVADADQAPTRDEIREVANCARALEHGLRSPLPLCKRLFRELHEILLGGVRGGNKQPGQFRKSQVFIGGRGGFLNARFVPPPAGPLMDGCLDALEAYLNPGPPSDDRETFHPIIDIALAHYQFEGIHPFLDGNGRLGRLIAVLSLCSHGQLSKPIVPISAYIDRNRREYYDLLLAVSTNGAWEEWTRFICNAISSEASDAVARTRKLHALRQSYTTRVTVVREGPHLSRLLDYLFAKPALTAAQAAEALSVSFNTAKKHIDRLASAGILTEHESEGRGRLYIAREILDIIDMDDSRLFADELGGQQIAVRTGT